MAHVIKAAGGKHAHPQLLFYDFFSFVNYSPLTEVGACDYPVVPTIISPTFVTQSPALMSHHGTVDTLSGFAPLTA